MKILHIIPSYWPAFGRGGPTWSVHILNKLLVGMGFDVTVFTTNIGSVDIINPGEEKVLDGVKIHYFPLDNRWLFSLWQYSRELRKELKKRIKDFDVVHITSTFLFASTLGAYFSRKFNKPYIISPRGNLMKEPLEHHFLRKFLYLRLIEKRNLANAAAIHFTAEIEKEEYLSAKLPLKKSFVIPSHYDYELEESYKRGLSYDFRNTYKIPRDAKIILFLGRISWKKGFDTLIPSLVEVIKKEPQAVLVVVGGDDGYKEVLLKMVKKYGLTEKVFFPGLLIGFSKEEAFKNSEVFVLPSYSENFAMAVLDSMAMGVPVVVTDKVGLAENVKKSGAGIVIKKDKNELVDAILKILDDSGPGRALRQKMGEAGKKLVKEEFKSEKVAEKWMRVYNDLTNK